MTHAMMHVSIHTRTNVRATLAHHDPQTQAYFSGFVTTKRLLTLVRRGVVWYVLTLQLQTPLQRVFACLGVVYLH